MQQVLSDVLSRRRDRAIAIILGVKERECDRHLPPQVGSKLRKVVLDQLNEFYDLCLDLMRSLDTGEVVLNQLYLEKIDQMHTALVENGGRGR
jgi:hypothetical protein